MGNTLSFQRLSCPDPRSHHPEGQIRPHFKTKKYTESWEEGTDLIQRTVSGKCHSEDTGKGEDADRAQHGPRAKGHLQQDATYPLTLTSEKNPKHCMGMWGAQAGTAGMGFTNGKPKITQRCDVAGLTSSPPQRKESSRGVERVTLSSMVVFKWRQLGVKTVFLEGFLEEGEEAGAG